LEPIKVLLDEWPDNPFFNLAFEEALYRRTQEPVIRIWRNDKVVVIGRHQCALLEVNAIEARSLGVKLVRRFTGGGAVYHDIGNVNYAIVIPRSIIKLNNVEEAFKIVGEAVVKALRSLGVTEVKYRPLNDIEVKGRKISGMAATLSRDKVFVHGALLVKSDLSVLWKVLRVSKEKLSDKKFVSSRTRVVTTLSEELGHDVSLDVLYEEISRELSDAVGAKDFEYAKASNDLLDEAKKLYRERYSQISWNLKYLNFVKNFAPKDEVEALLEIAKP
jgi:lipoate-protein ligase A